MHPPVLLGAVAVLDLVLLLGIVHGAGLPSSTQAIVLLVAAVLLELASFELAKLGSLSAGPAVWFLTARGVGPGWAAVQVLAATLLRTVLRGKPAPLEALPPLIALTLITSIPPAATVLLYLAALCAQVLPTDGMRLRWWLWQGGLAALGMASAAYLAESTWVALWALPVGMALQAVVWPLLGAKSEEPVTVTPMGLPSPRPPAPDPLQDFSRRLLEAGELEAILEMTVEQTRRMVDCRSVVIFLAEGQELAPAADHSPHHERLLNSALLNLREPAAWQAHLTQRTIRMQLDQEPEDRLMVGERSLLALPLGQHGVLYAGRADTDGFSPAEEKHLARIAQYLTAALTSARPRRSEQEELEATRASMHRFKEWTHQLEALLDGIASLTSTLDRAELFARTEAILTRLVPAEHGWIVVDGQLAHRWNVAEGSPEALKGWAGGVVESQLPLLLNDFTDSRWGPIVPEQGSLMAAPFGNGAVLVGSRQPNAFRRVHLHMLGMTGSVAGIALANSQLHQQVIKSQADLVQAGKMAAVGRLAAGLAHEINNPLMAMLTNVDLMRPADPEDQECLKSVRQGIQRCQGIVKSLLDFSRRPPPGDLVDLGEAVQSAMGFLDRARLKPMHLEIEPGVMVRGRRDELSQIAANLIGNACDAAKSQVWVRVRAQGAHGWIEVMDDGPGVPSELKDRIFEPFFTTKEVGQGTGLGLYLTYSLVREHGGKLTYENLPEGGTAFRAGLPTIKLPEAAGRGA